MTIQRVLASIQRWRDVRRTISVLRALDDRELNDLGIGRWRIPEVAQRTVQGTVH